MQPEMFMSACREGAARLEAALRTLHRELGDSLLRECCRDVKDAHAARDIVQEALIRVWLRCGTYRGDSALVHWIRIILRRCVLDFLRKRSECGVAMEDDDGELLPEVVRSLAQLSRDAALDPEAIAHDRDAQACWRRCFARFEAAAPEHAAVMRWIIEDGLSNAQVEQLLQRTPGATREFISQARKRIRIHFAEWYSLVAGAADSPAVRARHGRA